MRGFVLKLLILSIGGVMLTEKAAIQSNFGKKRKINRDLWIDNVRKRLKQNGLEHEDRKGKTHARVKDPSPNKICRRASCELEGCQMSFEEKVSIHLVFWPGKKSSPEFRTNNYDYQQSFIQSNLNWEKPAQQIVEQPSRRKATWMYTLPKADGRKVLVCSATFEDVLQISGTRVSYIQNRIKKGELDIKDLRGTNSFSPLRISDEAKGVVKEHFLSFPRNVAHYTRREENPLLEYLDSELNHEEMYRQYVQMMERNNNSEVVSSTYYKQMFVESGLKIGSPKTDTCDICTKLHVKIKATDPKDVNRLQQLNSELEKHQADADLAYKELENDSLLSATFPEQYFTMCIDMEQIMKSPNLECSDNFYRSKFNSYNCAITNTLDNSSTMYFYNCTDGNKGEAEISSILYRHITTNFNLLKDGEQRVLNVFSDRCTGQNNNYQNVALYKYIISLGYFTEIHQKFLYTGHSFLPCDRAFATIEKAAAKKKIYSPLDWIQIIKTACQINPFKVVEMKFSEFLDFSQLKDLIPIPNTLQVTHWKWISMSSSSPHLYQTKADFHSDTDFVPHTICEPFSRKRISNRSNWSTDHLIDYTPNALRSKPIRQSHHLLTSLKKLLDYTPTEKRTFFDNLISIHEEPESE